VRGLYSPQVGAVILVVLLSWTFYTVFDQQMFPQFYTQLFDSPERGQQVYGILNSIQVFLEAIMLGLVPILMRKVGVKTTLMLGMLVMFFRILGCAVFQDPVVISFVKLLHAPEVALCILPIFRYFTLHFNPALSATLYMVGFQVASQVGNIILSPMLGALRDDIGYQPTFYVIAGIVLVAGVYGVLILKRDDQHVEGDPFVRDSKGGSMIEKKA
jgi:MFS transporter, OHS family, lactose permease